MAAPSNENRLIESALLIWVESTNGASCGTKQASRHYYHDALDSVRPHDLHIIMTYRRVMERLLHYTSENVRASSQASSQVRCCCC